MTRIYPYKDRIADSVLIQEYRDQRKFVFWHILRRDWFRLSLPELARSIWNRIDTIFYSLRLFCFKTVKFTEVIYVNGK